jgi:hypothetical protein
MQHSSNTNGTHLCTRRLFTARVAIVIFSARQHSHITNGTHRYTRRPSTARIAIRLSAATKHSRTTESFVRPSLDGRKILDGCKMLWILRYTKDVTRACQSTPGQGPPPSIRNLPWSNSLLKCCSRLFHPRGLQILKDPGMAFPNPHKRLGSFSRFQNSIQTSQTQSRQKYPRHGSTETTMMTTTSTMNGLLTSWASLHAPTRRVRNASGVARRCLSKYEDTTTTGTAQSCIIRVASPATSSALLNWIYHPMSNGSRTGSRNGQAWK